MGARSEDRTTWVRLPDEERGSVGDSRSRGAGGVEAPRRTLKEDSDAFEAVMAERLRNCWSKIDDSPPLAGLVRVEFEAPISVRQDGTEGTPIEYLAGGKLPRADVFQQHKRAARECAVGAGELTGGDLFAGAGEVGPIEWVMRVAEAGRQPVIGSERDGAEDRQAKNSQCRE
jgi:hypothetical protein